MEESHWFAPGTVTVRPGVLTGWCSLARVLDSGQHPSGFPDEKDCFLEQQRNQGQTSSAWYLLSSVIYSGCESYQSKGA